MKFHDGGSFRVGAISCMCRSGCYNQADRIDRGIMHAQLRGDALARHTFPSLCRNGLAPFGWIKLCM